MESGEEGFDGPAGGDLLNAARAQTLRFSNFLLTLSTNVVPDNEQIADLLVGWLVRVTGDLFGDFDLLNEHCLKPAGTRNSQNIHFPADNKIVKIRAKVSVEQGNAQRGQMHAHVLLEVAHMYLEQEDGARGSGTDNPDRDYIGVHINVEALRNYLNERIADMPAGVPRPPKIYVNSKLLTKGTDNSNKWLTLQYINKDVAKDNDGGVRHLRHDEDNVWDANLSEVRTHMNRAGVNHNLDVNEQLNRNGFTVGGAIIDDADNWAPPAAPRVIRTTQAPKAPTVVRTTKPPIPPKVVRTTAPKRNR